MFVIHRIGTRPLVCTADLITVERIGALVYVEYAHKGQPSSTIASSEITGVEVIG